MPELQEADDEAAGVGAGVSPEGRRLVRDRFQVGSRRQAQSGGREEAAEAKPDDKPKRDARLPKRQDGRSRRSRAEEQAEKKPREGRREPARQRGRRSREAPGQRRAPAKGNGNGEARMRFPTRAPPSALALKLSMRSHYCGQVNESHIGQEIAVAGWVHRRRDHGGVIFVDLRDREGLLQIVCDPDAEGRVCNRRAAARRILRPCPRPGARTAGQHRQRHAGLGTGRGAGPRAGDPQPLRDAAVPLTTR